MKPEAAAKRRAKPEHRTGEDFRAAGPTLDALGTLHAPSWGAGKKAEGRMPCNPDDRGRLAPLPSGKGRGGWESVAVPRRLFRARPLHGFLEDLAAVAHQCGLFLARAVAHHLGAIRPPSGGHDWRVSAKREGCSEAEPLGDAGRERRRRGRRPEGP